MRYRRRGSTDRDLVQVAQDEVRAGDSIYESVGSVSRTREAPFWPPWRARKKRFIVCEPSDAQTYRYHGDVGGRAPGVSAADEEVRARLGGREAAHPLRCEQQLPARRPVSALRAPGERL